MTQYEHQPTDAQHERQQRRNQRGRYTSAPTCECCGNLTPLAGYYSDIRPALTARYSGEYGDLGLVLCQRCAVALGSRDDEGYVVYWQGKGGALTPRVPPITRKAELAVSPGWLSPEGNYYPCAYGEHLYLASALLEALDQGLYRFAEEVALKRDGWITLNYSDTDDRLAYAAGEFAQMSQSRLTDSQTQTLLALDALAAQVNENHALRRAIKCAFDLWEKKE